MNAKSLIAVFAAVALPLCLSAATNDLTTALQKGLFEEEANHDLDAAIRTYQAIAAQFDKDRKLAATAIFRLGECFRKKGNTNDANAQYEKVLREFADQSALVSLSRQNLELAGVSPALVTGSATAAAARQEQKRLLQEEIHLAEQALEEQQKRFDQGLISRESLMASQREVLRSKRQLAALDSGVIGSAEENSVKEIVTSSEAEEVKRIQAMIKDSPDLINAVDPQGSRRTPLHEAANKGQLIVARFLLENGADVTAKNSDGSTPLHLAAAAGHRAMAELLISHKAPVEAFDDRGSTPLHAAAEKGFKNVVEFLLTKNSDVNARTATGPAPLHLALANGFRSVTEFLLAHGANPSTVVPEFHTTGNERYQGAPFHIAAQRDEIALADLLLAKGAQINTFSDAGLTPLHVAAQKGSLEVAKLLLTHGADVNVKALRDPYKGWPPLAVAVAWLQRPIMALLLESGADPNAQFDSLYNLVLQVRLPSSERGLTSLLMAVSKGNLEIADLLLAHKADPNLTNSAGVAPLFPAIWNRDAAHEALAKALLEHGADPNARVGEGNTALMEATLRGDKPVIQLLLAYQAKVDAKDKRGRTALRILGQAPISQATLEIASLLVDGGADVNALDVEGKTLLSSLPTPGDPKTFSDRLQAFDPTVLAGLKAMLREHGALQDLPRPDRIEIGRKSSGYSSAIFAKGTNDWNQFTLFELLGVQYDFLTRYPQGEKRERYQFSTGNNSMTYPIPYPDLGHVQLRRAGQDLKSWKESTIDIATAISSGDCSKDLILVWGDVIEIPVLDHPLNEQWPGFSAMELETLKKCLSREVHFVVKGTNTNVTLTPGIDIRSFGVDLDTKAPFWIKPVLLNSHLLLASSDLTRVKVSRTDPASGQKRECILDCSQSSPAPELWLRDGDVIEVPEKP